MNTIFVSFKTMEFIPTTRGRRKLLLYGYAYIVDKQKDNVTYWRCDHKESCGGRLYTEDEVIQGEASNHSGECSVKMSVR